MQTPEPFWKHKHWPLRAGPPRSHHGHRGLVHAEDRRGPRVAGRRERVSCFEFSTVLRLTHPGDGQRLVEVLPSGHAKPPGGRTIQHDVERHDPRNAYSPSATATRTHMGATHTHAMPHRGEQSQRAESRAQSKVMGILKRVGGSWGREGGRGVGRHQPGWEAVGQTVESDSHYTVSHRLITGSFFSFLFKKKKKNLFLEMDIRAPPPVAAKKTKRFFSPKPAATRGRPQASIPSSSG